MTLTFRTIALAITIQIAALVAGPPALAQNLFEPVIKVNDQVVTRYEVQQRARLLELFRAPGDPRNVAREQLVEERLKLEAARANGIELSDENIQDGMEEFAQRTNMSADELVQQLENAGVAGATYREFVRAGMAWRELSRARFGNRVSVDQSDIERAERAMSGRSNVRVLLSEIIMPVEQGQEEAVRSRATRLSEITSTAEFSEQARQFSATASAQQGGRLDWTPITELPPQLRPVLMALAPGEVSDPIPLEGAIALFQMRDIQEFDTSEPTYSAIEYAAYYIPGGRSEEALNRAAEIRGTTDTCDDLYGVAHGQPDNVLDRESRAPDEIPRDIALELAKLDPGEVSTALTRSNGETLMFLMLCGRAPEQDEDRPSTEELAASIRDRRLQSFADAYLEQLRAEARIIELE